ncbi:unnamed protein product [Cladocopium goreaui]|uniref:Uncharacterized protein n=1 Tax=Cladocopium goreaui TaxID=2562237 RepID=A0A9P1GGK7_9DINO|nr:unnamed protein product [Cladocopium goreaui]
MGQASCSEVFKGSPQRRAQGQGTPRPAPRAAPPLVELRPSEGTQVDVQVLRNQLQAKEISKCVGVCNPPPRRALQLLRNDAVDHKYLLQLLDARGLEGSPLPNVPTVVEALGDARINDGDAAAGDPGTLEVPPSAAPSAEQLEEGEVKESSAAEAAPGAS